MKLDFEYGSYVEGRIEYIDALYERASKKASKVPPVPPVTATVAELSLDIALPEKAIVLDGSVTVTAKPAGSTTIGNVAHVRASSGDPVSPSNTLVVDFGGMRTVSAVSVPAPPMVQEVRAWLGTKFNTEDIPGATPFGAQGRQFPEVQTRAPSAHALGGP